MRTGVELHGVTLNVRCNHEPLFEHVVSMLGADACAAWNRPDIAVDVTWRTEPLPDGGSVFDGAGADALGKRMLVRDDELIWFDTHRDKDLQLRFRADGDRYAFAVDYWYHPSARKLERTPDYEQQKFFALLRYVVHFPIAWWLERTRGWALLHASAVSDGERAVLIAGPGGAGKTTTCLGLTGRGMSIVSENLLFYDGEDVHPLPEPIRLTPDSLALLATSGLAPDTLVQAGRLKHKAMFRLPDTPAGGVRPEAIFIPRFAGRGFVRQIEPDEASEVIGATNRLTLELNDYYWYTAALDALWPLPGNAERQLRQLQRLTARVPCYALGIDRSAGVEPVLERILSLLEERQSDAGRRRPEVVEIRSRPPAVPIRCYCSADLLPDDAARAQLDTLAMVPGLARHVSVLPDVHYKSRNPSPTGTVAVSRHAIVPRAIDQGINCGMRILATPVPVRDLMPLLDTLYSRLRDALPIGAHEMPLLSGEQCERMLVDGIGAAGPALGLEGNDLDRTENRGHMMPEIPAASVRARITEKAIRKGNPWVGTLGAGNHFLELQEVVEVLSPPEARALGLEPGLAVFMMHTDSRKLGKHIMKPIREEVEQRLGLSAGDGRSNDGLWAVPADGELARRYVCGLVAASHAALANRAAITMILRQTLRSVLGDAGVPVPLVYDCGHETIQREYHDREWLWVHRHGASSARPPGVLTHDPVLERFGQPVPIPGSMGTESYVAVARPAVDGTFHSVAHGAGRVLEKIRAAETFDPDVVEGSVRAQGIRLYRYGSDNIAGQAPASFKDVHGVVAAMESFGLVRPVVRLRPVAVLKG